MSALRIASVARTENCASGTPYPSAMRRKRARVAATREMVSRGKDCESDEEERASKREMAARSR